MGKYLKIFHLGVDESTGLLKANWGMSQPTLWSISEIIDRERRVSCILFFVDQATILMLLCSGSLQIMMTSH